ncbi:neuroendocrine protein 7B2 precursor [Elysia marginata]|uniref:Neuroendocrine protein 7B2 n=1 Tax=Elysia marginata TaxID=1093978 RepID=A0AAV4F497_9GAST|nr:neuroendocrine protein 7B2 precursor [Elysia marginata]
MAVFFPLLMACVLSALPGLYASGVYDPYMDAAEMYRMQLLANAFQYPGHKLGGAEALGGAGVLDVPYGLMGDGGANDRLVDFEEESGPAYWPEELMAELAAAAAAENDGASLAEEEEEEEEDTQQEPIEVEEERQEETAAENGDKQQEDGNQAQAEEAKEATKHSGAQLRDQEHLEHSALHGYQSVSGGTVNGQNKQSKTDKALPAYCNPPNPCPVGKTAEDNCVENFENSAENNQRLLSQQECPCDTEHMFTCPEGSRTVSSKAQGSSAGDAAPTPDASQQLQLNKVIAELSDMEKQEEDSMENNPNFSATHKRFTLVAKKSPHLIRKRSETAHASNPYLEGQQIKIAAKKSPNLAGKPRNSQA